MLTSKPLDTVRGHETMEFTLTVNNCMGCSFCPQDKLNKAYDGNRRMNLPDFFNISSKLPANVEIHFSGFSEPFLNTAASMMMSDACGSGRTVALYTTLAGFRETDAMRVAHCKFGWIRIHVPDTQSFRYPPDKWLKLFDLFRSLGKPFTAMSMGYPEGNLLNELDERGVDIELPDMISRAGNLWQPNRIDGPVTCWMERWHHNVVLPNGDVVLCCMDYSLKMKLGNIFEQSYQEIYDEAEKYRLNLNPSEDSPCRTCEWAKTA